MSTPHFAPPSFTLVHAEQIARVHYGLSVKAKSLNSYSDQNFLLTNLQGEKWVLKIAHPETPKTLLEAQQAALHHLAEQTAPVPVPRVLSNQMGASLFQVQDEAGTLYWMWLVTYLPGRLLAQVNPQTPALLNKLGMMLGHLNHALATFDHPALHRVFRWDLQHTLLAEDRLAYLADANRRGRIEKGLARFAKMVQPRLPELRQQIIHNDANDHNILVAPSYDDPPQITGLIDFGDMVYTQVVNEVAIAMAYAMLDQPDPMAAGRAVLAGYHQIHPLTEAEVAVLYPLIEARLCMSVTGSAYQQAQDPTNAYIAVSEKPAWHVLDFLDDLHPRLATMAFRETCGWPPIARAHFVMDWLQDNRTDFAPIVQPDPASTSLICFDLSVGSPLLANINRMDTEALTTALFEDMARAEAPIGLGRYGEARLLYAGDQFARGGWANQPRTLHLGVDLLMPAGTPIYAPLDGTVYALRNNNLPYDYGPTVLLEHRLPDNADICFYTLYGHLSEHTLGTLEIGQVIPQGTPFATLGTALENGGWPPHLHVQIMLDALDSDGDFPGVAAPDEWTIWHALCPDPNLLLRIPETALLPLPPSQTTLQERRRAALGHNLSISYEEPLHIVHGKGAFLYDAMGRAFLDGVNNVCHVGHQHPQVMAALARQMRVLNTNTRYLHEHILTYAERLAATFPDPLSVCFFVNSGSEANDLALRLAQTYTGQKDWLVLDAAYHGNLGSLIDLSPYKHDGPGGSGPPPHVHPLPLPDGYRGPYRHEDAEAGVKYATFAQKAIHEVQQTGRGVAGFIAESLPGCGGQIVLPQDFLQETYAHVRAAGGVCIADEVQVGFGRVGTHFWGFETQGVIPDIVTLGKPIGNGHPLGAVVTTRAIAEAFHNGMEYFNTFGGNPVSCAVGLAVLDVIQTEQLQEHAHDVGVYLKEQLTTLQQTFPLIGEVRGSGLFLGIELVTDPVARTPAPKQAAYVVNRLRTEGILLSTDGPFHNVLKIKPPLVFSRANADLVVERLGRVLHEDLAQPSAFSMSQF